jgi:hypothetical protein
MWPTFYIPRGRTTLPGFVDPNIDGLCGQFSINTSSSGTIPTPGTVQDGDTHLIVVSYQNTGGTYPGGGGAPWYIFAEKGLALIDATSFGTTEQRIYWRIYDSADGDFTITTSGAGGTYGSYASIIVRNQNLADPVFSYAVLDANNTGNCYGPRWEGAITDFDIANDGDLAIFASCPRPNFSASGENPNADFSCTNTTSSTPASGHAVAGLAAYRSKQNNKLGYTPSMSASGWTATNLTVTAPSPGAYMPGCTLLATGTAGKHYVEQTVTLEAGKAYLLACAHTGQNFAYPFGNLFLTYVKEDLTEHGIGVGRAGSAHNVTGSTEVVWGGAGKPAHTLIDTNSTNYYGAITSFMITPSATETYKIRVYVTTEDGSVHQPSEAYAGGATVYQFISGLTLQEGPGWNQMPTFLPESSTPVAIGDSQGIIMPIPDALYSTGVSADNGWHILTLRRAGGRRPACRLSHVTGRNYKYRFDDDAVTDTSTGYLPALSGYEALTTSHLVYSYLAQKKFYFEMTPNSWGGGVADDSYSIGFCVAPAMQQKANYATVVGDATAQYAYTATGKIYDNGVLDGSTVTAWSASDVIGASIDFTAYEIKFYRNGTLLKTIDFSGSAYRDSPFLGHFGVFSAYSQGKDPSLSYNFAGPFSHKPSGFYAYDFDNE